MSVTRRVVLEQLARASDAAGRETTTKQGLVAMLDTDEATLESHLDGLAACDLAKICPDDRVRITITGEQLLALDTDELVIVDLQ
jgi:hypothetical protein